MRMDNARCDVVIWTGEGLGGFPDTGWLKHDRKIKQSQTAAEITGTKLRTCMMCVWLTGRRCDWQAGNAWCSKSCFRSAAVVVCTCMHGQAIKDDTRASWLTEDEKTGAAMCGKIRIEWHKRGVIIIIATAAGCVANIRVCAGCVCGVVWAHAWDQMQDPR